MRSDGWAFYGRSVRAARLGSDGPELLDLQVGPSNRTGLAPNMSNRSNGFALVCKEAYGAYSGPAPPPHLRS